MACGPTHKFVGGAVGFCISAMENTNNQKTIDPISATALGSLFGALPDLLEPAINPHHRQFCNSLATLTPVDDITLGGDKGFLVLTLISMFVIWRLSSATSDK